VKLGERIQTHPVEPYSATRGEATVSRSRPRCFGTGDLANGVAQAEGCADKAGLFTFT
jgi:hypothetical protein